MNTRFVFFSSLSFSSPFFFGFNAFPISSRLAGSTPRLLSRLYEIEDEVWTHVGLSELSTSPRCSPPGHWHTITNPRGRGYEYLKERQAWSQKVHLAIARYCNVMFTFLQSVISFIRLGCPILSQAILWLSTLENIV